MEDNAKYGNSVSEARIHNAGLCKEISYRIRILMIKLNVGCAEDVKEGYYNIAIYFSVNF